MAERHALEERSLTRMLNFHLSFHTHFSQRALQEDVKISKRRANSFPALAILLPPFSIRSYPRWQSRPLLRRLIMQIKWDKLVGRRRAEQDSAGGGSLLGRGDEKNREIIRTTCNTAAKRGYFLLFFFFVPLRSRRWTKTYLKEGEQDCC